MSKRRSELRVKGTRANTYVRVCRDGWCARKPTPSQLRKTRLLFSARKGRENNQYI